MTRRPLVIVAILCCLWLPVALVAADALSCYVLNRTDTIVSSGETREYILHVPASYVPTRPAPLVISMHGAMNWPSVQMNLTRWNSVSDENGFIVVYPAGRGAGPKNWSMDSSRTPSRMPDVVFISELIDKLEAEYNIDPTRVYADGMSGGAGMAFVLSCTLSHRIAAIGSVAAAEVLPWSWCPDSRPLPTIAFHGTGDRLTPYDGGKVWLAPDPFPSIPMWTANWARRNRCAPNPIDTLVASDVTRREYAGCADGAAVVFYTIDGGGHTWPGGTPLPEWTVGPTSRSIDATNQMWAFFRDHRLVRK